MNRLEKAGAALLGTFLLGLFGLLVFRIGWVNHVENYELGYVFDSRTGRVTVLTHPGYVVTSPILVKVYTVDLRPMQVCINANSRVLNCKLVKFNPQGLDTFLSWHGNGDYKGGSSVDSNGHAYGGNLTQILTSYAFDGSGKEYPFMTVIRELKPENGADDTRK